MRLGIRKIEWIDAAQVNDYSCVAPGSSVRLAGFIKDGGTLTELPFVPEVANFEEQWLIGDDGQYSSAIFDAAIRRDKAGFKPVLMKLQGKKAIWLLTLINGEQWVIGSPECVPTFSFSDTMSGISSSELAINISCESLHGVLKNVAD